ncbi:MAG TPA: hypothetical protein VMU47_11055 [Caldimonas sp.]|nr:hypothetical protein [Caldimonas sp.]
MQNSLLSLARTYPMFRSGFERGFTIGCGLGIVLGGAAAIILAWIGNAP